MPVISKICCDLLGANCINFKNDTVLETPGLFLRGEKRGVFKKMSRLKEL
jgi:hypothetical protein